MAALRPLTVNCPPSLLLRGLDFNLSKQILLKPNNLSNFNVISKMFSNIITYWMWMIFRNLDTLKRKLSLKFKPIGYLHFSSCHPLYVQKSISKGLATQANKLSSNKVIS